MKNLKKTFEKNGYVIVPANKLKLDLIRKIIANLIKKDLKKIKENNLDKILNNFHKFVKPKEINKIRFKIYNLINRNEEFSNIY